MNYTENVENEPFPCTALTCVCWMTGWTSGL